MRILAIGDVHGDLPAYRWFSRQMIETKADVGILAGDLTRSRKSRVEEKKIKNILGKAGKTFYFVMGNDDQIEWTSENNFININQRDVWLGEYQFIGYHYTNPFIKGIFEKTEEEQDNDFKSLIKLVRQNTILVTHGPPFGILDKGILDLHAGSTALKKFVNRAKPLVHIFGHIHQNCGSFKNFFNVSYWNQKSCCLIELPLLTFKFIKQELRNDSPGIKCIRKCAHYIL
jgi:Icc-related predicted phosphoesterase